MTEPAAIKEALGPRSVVLVGLMGAGKSAIGRKLAARLGVGFVDADKEIEKAANMGIPDIFEHYGEPEFRRLEASVMTRLLRETAQVLATGGGAFVNPETRAAIRQSGVSVWLSADLDLLMSRVSRKPTRPLLQSADPRGVMKKLIEERYPIYAEADIEVASRDLTKDEMADQVMIALAGFLSTSEDGTRQTSARGTT